jgi:2-dehydropantoate 2-reductase
MRIIILGSGGVGGYLGAKLWKGGYDVIFVARGKHLEAMKQHGLTLNSLEGKIIVHAPFTDTLTHQAPADLIVVSVKSFDTQSAVELTRTIVHPSTIILSIQNGVENEELLASILGRNHILSGIAYIFSIIIEPGIVSHLGGAGKFKFGELDGGFSERTAQLENIFKKAGIDAQASVNIQHSLWEKWIFICGLAGMTAYTRKSIGKILSDSSLVQMLTDVVHEAADVARGCKIDRFFNIEEKVLNHYNRLPSLSTSSMFHDVIHGKRAEVEALNGAVVRFGRKLGIPTPANETIVNALKAFM